MSNNQRYLITTALPYANGPIHIGHLAGVYIPADIYVRYLRAQGADVVMVGGSDEHGVPISIKAKQEGKTPQQVVDHYHEILGTSLKNIGVSFDIYSRTSSERHHEVAADFFKELEAEGKFQVTETEQYYDEAENQFLADRYITGTCPHCQNPEAYGDQCEKCGTSLSPDELINPKSALSGNVPVKKATKHWYLPLDQYEDWLKEWIVEGKQGQWKSNVYGQCKSWIDQGLHPRAVTRDLDWGVPVPVEGGEGKVLYVWFDAPLGYVSATQEFFDGDDDWKKYWKTEESGGNTKLIHFIGKDNIVFHCIIFPAMLKAHGEYILPENVPANEFLNLEGNKISTSRNWAVWLHEYLEEFPGQEDALRYTLTAIMPETKDADFTWKDFQARNNNELVAIFGNFVNRTVVLTNKYWNGIVPSATTSQEVMDAVAHAEEQVGKALEQYRFRDALNAAMNLARFGNKYLADREPWKLYKANADDPQVAQILFDALQIVAALSVIFEPFLPFSAQKLQKMLDFELNWHDLTNAEFVKSSHQIGKAELLFQKIEDETIERQMDKLKKPEPVFEGAPAKEEIDFDTFQKMDIRVATILSAQKVKGADRLLELQLDTGLDQRTVVSGIAEHYQPEDVVGKQVTLLANLAPRKIRGVVSHGMILMAEDLEGNLKLVSPEAVVDNGSVIG